jgi:ATP-dependent protease Clp ATPase subunit
MTGNLPSNRAREIACTFCGSSRAQVGTIIAGPDGYICDGCVSLADGVLSGVPAGNAAPELEVVPAGANTNCAFCGKQRARVAGLASAGRITICDECVGLCQEIIAEQRSTD